MAMKHDGITKLAEDRYQLKSIACLFCKSTAYIELKGSQVYKMHQGEHVQEVLHNYDEHIRERFISGTCESCWRNIYGEGE